MNIFNIIYRQQGLFMLLFDKQMKWQLAAHGPFETFSMLKNREIHVSINFWKLSKPHMFIVRYLMNPKQLCTLLQIVYGIFPQKLQITLHAISLLMMTPSPLRNSFVHT